MTTLSRETLQERIAKSELGSSWINDPLMEQDVWPLTALGYTQEECQIQGRHNLHFERITLPWLKLLTKLTVKYASSHCAMSTIGENITYLAKLSEFLVKHGYTNPNTITDALLKTFIGKDEKRQRYIAYAVKLWAEEGWLKLPFIPSKWKFRTPKVETIPEEVLYQVYEHLYLLPEPLERLFRLQIALGCRINEMLILPRNCLKKEGDKWLLLRWIAKRKHWRHYEVHPAVAELVQAQHKFLDIQFGADSPFDKLFCSVSAWDIRVGTLGQVDRFKANLTYSQTYLKAITIHNWLRAFREEADLKDKHGNRFALTSHMFRRTKASVMAYCEVEDEYIAAVLGHGSLDMLPHYRKRSLDKLEKESFAEP